VGRRRSARAPWTGSSVGLMKRASRLPIICPIPMVTNIPACVEGPSQRSRQEALSTLTAWRRSSFAA
jgi:hypothetical protein